MPLRALFDAPMVASLHDMSRRSVRQCSAHPSSCIVSRKGEVPLTMIQEHLWASTGCFPWCPFSNMPYAARLIGPLNVTALEQSFNAIIQRHETLRTTFTTIRRAAGAGYRSNLACTP